MIDIISSSRTFVKGSINLKGFIGTIDVRVELFEARYKDSTSYPGTTTAKEV